MKVKALKPIREKGIDYNTGDVFDATTERGTRLYQLGMVDIGYTVPEFQEKKEEVPPEDAPKSDPKQRSFSF